MEPISVILPTYNRSHCIQRAVRSVLTQSYPVQEVIIADDCSQDNTEEVLSRINDTRVRYYRLPQNRGAGGARNFGVEKARYDLIAFHDSDDEWMENKIERQMAYWEKHPEFGMIYSAYETLVAGEVPDRRSGRKLEGNILPELLYKNTIGAPTVLMKKQIFYEAGGFDESMHSLEDWDFAIKVAKKYPIGFVPEVLLKVNTSDGGVSSNKAAYYQNRCYMLRKHRTEYLENGMFDKTVQYILKQAETDGLLAQIEKMIMLYLSY